MRTFPLFLLFLAPLFTLAQPWAPLRPGEKYHYATNGGTSFNDVEASLRIDSSQTLNADTLRYLNRILLPCDTCGTCGTPSYFDTLCYALADQPQFLMRQARQQNGGAWIFQAPDTMAVNTLADSGASWAFSVGVSATGGSFWTDIVLGEADSLKRISLSGGGEIVLSRGHGIVRWHLPGGPDYRLVGLDGRPQHLGVHWPMLEDYYDFQPGDVFCYQSGSFDMDYDYEEAGKYTILSRMDYPDSIVYAVEWVGKYIQSTWLGQLYTTTGVWRRPLQPVIYKNQPAPYLAGGPYWPVNPNFGVEYASEIAYDFWYPTSQAPLSPSIATMLLLPDSADGRLVAQWGAVRQDPLERRTHIHFSDFSYGPGSKGEQGKYEQLNNPYGWSNQSDYAFKQGVGLISAHYIWMEGTSYFDLLGYQKGPQTYGSILPDSAYKVSLDELGPSAPNLRLFPNPASMLLHLEAGAPFSGTLAVLDVTGREVLRQEARGSGVTLEVDVSALPNGFYLLRLESGQNHAMRKFVVSR